MNYAIIIDILCLIINTITIMLLLKVMRINAEIENWKREESEEIKCKENNLPNPPKEEKVEDKIIEPESEDKIAADLAEKELLSDFEGFKNFFATYKNDVNLAVQEYFDDAFRKLANDPLNLLSAIPLQIDKVWPIPKVESLQLKYNRYHYLAEKWRYFYRLSPLEFDRLTMIIERSPSEVFRKMEIDRYNEKQSKEDVFKPHLFYYSNNDFSKFWENKKREYIHNLKGLARKLPPEQYVQAMENINFIENLPCI